MDWRRPRGANRKRVTHLFLDVSYRELYRHASTMPLPTALRSRAAARPPLEPGYSRSRGAVYARSSFSCALIRRACGLPRTGR